MSGRKKELTVHQIDVNPDYSESLDAVTFNVFLDLEESGEKNHSMHLPDRQLSPFLVFDEGIRMVSACSPLIETM